MNTEQWMELIDLYVAEALPEALRLLVESHLQAHMEAAADAATLRMALTRLHAAPAERPDTWFAERLLDSLLREHSAAQPTILNSSSY